MEMKIKNLHAAGIDVGSKSHFVAVGQGDDEIKEFGVSHSSHQEIICYLRILELRLWLWKVLVITGNV
jgi:transposase